MLRLRQVAPLAIVLCAIAIAVAFYLQALHYPLISDDARYTTENHKLAELRWTELWHLLVEPYNCCFEFLPLRDLSFWLDIKLFGLTPSALRVHNIILYLLSMPLVYAATLGLWRYFRPADSDAPYAAAAVTALFALHPALVASVVWVSGRKYILPDMFAMFALWLAVSARREQGFSVPHAAAAVLSCEAMMLAKSSYAGLAPVIALLWLLFWLDIPAPDRRRSLLLWPFAVVLLTLFLAVIFIFFNRGYDSVPFYFGVESFTKPFAILGWLARLAISPENRHFLYPVFKASSYPVMAVTGAVLLSVSVAAGVMLLRKRSLEGFALVAFLLLCLPYMDIFPHRAPSLVADRYLALAAWPAVLLVVALAWRMNQVPRTVLLFVIAMLWGMQTAQRARDWRSFEALIDADYRAFPESSMPAMYKTDIQLTQGLIDEAAATAAGIAVPEVKDSMMKLVAAHRAVLEAIATGKSADAKDALLAYGRSLEHLPEQAKWNTSLGMIWQINVKYLGFEWQKLIRNFRDDAVLQDNAGLSLLAAGRPEDATIYLRSAAGSPSLPESLRGTVYKHLGDALLASGRMDEAEHALRSALEHSPPDLTAYCALSELYKQAARPDEAERAEAECHR
ncbi:MAG TPA: tetratricopeptide repeat protein [Gallionella sp.]|nr:tetratricopeptide repeat protein [Gallionella sp.]